MRIEELDFDINKLIDEFVFEEKELLEVDASEQAISSRLASKFELLSTDWNVDCEYNRSIYSVKTLKYALSKNGDVEERNVVPDIIIHKRKTILNLLAVEIKKVSNGKSI